MTEKEAKKEHEKSKKNVKEHGNALFRYWRLSCRAGIMTRPDKLR